MLTKEETEILKKLKTIFADYEFNDEPVIIKTHNDNLYTDLGLDSLAVVELVMMCENEFGIVIEDETIEKLRTVKDIISVIEKGKIH